MNLKNLLFASVIVLSANASFGQNIVQISTKSASHDVNINIQEVALLALKSSTGTAITLAGTAPTVAGEAMTFDNVTDSSIFMNYSSIVKGTSTRNISVALSSNVPTGLKLTVVAGANATGGAGNLGTASGELTLSTAPQSIVTGIGSTYTGSGASKGRNLTYKLNYLDDVATNYSALRYVDLVDAAPITITYTLSDI
ncbi:MAG: hypothetical protein Q7J19_01100 [Lutibacter sp.]|nr:hypothetical protein [Lutibacter sp.]